MINVWLNYNLRIVHIGQHLIWAQTGTYHWNYDFWFWFNLFGSRLFIDRFLTYSTISAGRIEYHIYSGSLLDTFDIQCKTGKCYKVMLTICERLGQRDTASWHCGQWKWNQLKKFYVCFFIFFFFSHLWLFPWFVQQKHKEHWVVIKRSRKRPRNPPDIFTVEQVLSNQHIPIIEYKKKILYSDQNSFFLFLTITQSSAWYDYSYSLTDDE